MGIVGQALENEKVLNNWRDLKVLSQVEEKEEDIWLFIARVDHGDNFVIVGTNDGHLYEYGYYLNRKEFEYYKPAWIREPKMYKKEDAHATVSNEIFWRFERDFKKSHMSFGADKKYDNKNWAQKIFESFLAFMKSKAEGEYRISEGRYYIEKLKYWLELNELNSDENMKLLEETPFDSKINGVDGIAGKRELDKSTVLYADSFRKIIANGQRIDRRKVTKVCNTDEWGVATYRIRLDKLQKT